MSNEYPWNILFWLSSVERIGGIKKKIIRFTGLDVPFTVFPVLPSRFNFLTRQPYYFLEDLEYMGCLHLPDGWERDERETIEIADNYLFEYSLIDTESMITARPNPKNLSPKFNTDYLVDDTTEYIMTDNLHAAFYEPQTLRRIKNRMPPVGYIQNPDGLEIGSDAMPKFNNLYKEFHERLEILIRTMKEREEIKLNSQPYTAAELEVFPYIHWYTISSEEELIDTLESYGFLGKHPPIEFIEGNKKYASTLLQFYFSGLRDPSPLNQFKNYYNIIEYFFEDISAQQLANHLQAELNSRIGKLSNNMALEELQTLLSKKIDVSGLDSADYSKEEHQIRMVLEHYIDTNKIRNFLCNLPSNEADHYKNSFQSYNLPPLNHGDPEIIHKVAERIYKLRNAVFHSKRGQKPIVPFTQNEDFISNENDLLKFIATEIILQTGEQYTQ